MKVDLLEAVQDFPNEKQDNFSIVGDKQLSPRDLQQQMQKLQKANWVLLQIKLKFLVTIYMLGLVVISYFFSRWQTNFNFNTVPSLFSLFYTNLKSCRAALCAHPIITLNSVPALLHEYIFMSLLNLDSQHQVLEQIAHLQNQAINRPTLVICYEKILSNYGTQLLQDVLTPPQGLLLTLFIPLASRTFVRTFYETIPLPMPQLDNACACFWETEAPYLVVFESRQVTALVTEAHLANCFGSAEDSVCYHVLATEAFDLFVFQPFSQPFWSLEDMHTCALSSTF